MKILVHLLLLALLSCQPATTSTPNEDDTPAKPLEPGAWGESFPLSTARVQYAFMGLPYRFVALSGLSGEGWKLTASQVLPSGLSLALVDQEALLSGVPNVGGKQLNELRITATQGGVTRTVSFTLIVRGDPLRPFQWHLENDGESYFSAPSSPGVVDEDINARAAWEEAVFGAQVRVAVSDSGVEVGHLDLARNMLSGEHRNYRTALASSGYLGTPSTYGDAHGTAVAGIIAAVGWNDLGGTGVAPLAKLAGFQFLNSQQTISMMIHQASGEFDVFNYSYGSGVNVDLPTDELYLAHLRDRATRGRGGRGQIFVKAAGNEYQYFCREDAQLGDVCAPQNANIPADNHSPFVIVVGATAAKGLAASYSNAGSNLWVVAPGGEDGDDGPAIVTTDLSTCAQGFSTNLGLWAYNQFETTNGSETFLTYNPQCNFTSMMNGTSSAAPNVTGVIALMLSANPSLSWRDVKHILAMSADVIDAAAAETDHYQAQLRLAGHVYEQGWVKNAAGKRFHNWYGFGRINAAAAVRMAKSYATPLPSWFETNPDFTKPLEGRSGLNLAIPDANPLGVSDSRTIQWTEDVVIESVQLKITAIHPRSGSLGVELTSPSGTKSILLNINNALLLPVATGSSPDQDLDVVLTTHAFYGESATGTWEVKVVDGLADSKIGRLKSWSINVLGHVAP